MKWKLSAKETAGVVGVGVVLALLARKAANEMDTPDAHQTAMVVGGASLYVAGVVIGANRPSQGWIEAGGY